MRADVFIASVQRGAGLATADEAREAARAVLRTLGEHLPDGWAHHLAAELPPEIGSPLRLASREMPVTTDDGTGFLNLVGQRADVATTRAADLTRVVFTVVTETSDPALVRRICDTLTDGVRSLLVDTSCHLVEA
jgi:uncharacterized protein (DUF2267 family)